MSPEALAERREGGPGAEGWAAGEPNVGTAERVASTIGGAALAIYGITQKSSPGAMLALLGGALVFRGATGFCPVYAGLGVDTAEEEGATRSSLRAKHSIRVEESVSVNKPAAELYAFWRDFRNLARFMHNVESVKLTNETRSHWTVKGPFGATYEYDAEIINEEPNQLIAWRSLEGADVDNAGSVRFLEEPGGRGTVVRVVFEYRPTGGRASGAVAKLIGQDPAADVRDDLRRFKSLVEAGEIPTTEGQPQGGKAARRRESA